MKFTLEACIESLEEGICAEEKGANQLELCANLYLGGTTPDYIFTKDLLSKVKIPVRVMIRPRGGDFFYTTKEFSKMKEDIKTFKELPIEGFVFGILTKEHKVDFKRTRELIELSYPKKVTFHKAIDEVSDIVISSAKLIEIGVDKILSSGRCETALDGKDTLNKMIKATNDNIIVAGKVTYDNLNEITKVIPSSSYHGRRIVKF